MLLHFSQQLYAHALTLQEVIRNPRRNNLRGFETEIRPPGCPAIRGFYQNSKRTWGFRKPAGVLWI